MTSDVNLFHEIELFPTALIPMLQPVHIALFQDGKVIIIIECFITYVTFSREGSNRDGMKESKTILQMNCKIVDNIYY